MKFFSILHKDFRLLLRSKSSAFTVFIGPILIVALILFAFSSSQDISFSVGILGSESADTSTQEFIQGLTDEGYIIVNYTSIDDCTKDMESSKTNLCLDFSAIDTQVEVAENETIKKQIVFYVDQSRINVVESIIFSIGSTIEGKSEELTEEKTGNILAQIGESITELKAAQESASEIVEESLKESAQAIQDSADAVAADASNADESLDSAASDGSTGGSEISSVSARYSTLVTELDVLMEELEDIGLNGSAEDAYDEVEILLDGAIASDIDQMQDLIDSINSEVTVASRAVGEISESNEIILTEITEIEALIESLTLQLNSIESDAVAIAGLSGQSIENEYEISINEIVSSSDKSLFMFPYYLVLLILFVGMMLSSTLVVIERQSMAFFRNYTSPTSSFTHMLSRFTSTLIIICLQVAIVLSAVYLFLGIPILGNYPITILILFLTITLFIFLGYLIGYLFKTQEGITIAFISLGSVCAFLSNLILPIETFSHSIRSMLMFNPYMLCSEMLKKSIVFGSSFANLQLELITLSSYLLSVIFAVLLLQEFSMTQFSFNLGKRHVLKRPHINSDKHFVLEDGVIVEDIGGMLLAIKKMSASELEIYGVGKNNEIALWISDVFKERRLVRSLRKAKDKQETLKVLKEYVAKKEEK